jgi:hypothetical protein
MFPRRKPWQPSISWCARERFATSDVPPTRHGGWSKLSGSPTGATTPSSSASSLPYNLLDRRAETEIIPMCLRPMIWELSPGRPLAQGVFWQGRYRDAKQYSTEGSQGSIQEGLCGSHHPTGNRCVSKKLSEESRCQKLQPAANGGSLGASSARNLRGHHRPENPRPIQGPDRRCRCFFDRVGPGFLRYPGASGNPCVRSLQFSRMAEIAGALCAHIKQERRVRARSRSLSVWIEAWQTMDSSECFI